MKPWSYCGRTNFIRAVPPNIQNSFTTLVTAGNLVSAASTFIGLFLKKTFRFSLDPDGQCDRLGRFFALWTTF